MRPVKPPPLRRLVHILRPAFAVTALILVLTPAARAEDPVTSGNPGEVFAPSLKRSLVPPTAESRWRDLPLYGQELFDTTRAGEALQPPESGPVSPDYVLGPGDQLTVFVSSIVDTSYALTLDREGKVFLPRVGSTYLWGLSFVDAEQFIKGRIGSILKNARIQVSMGRMRTIDVFVLGEVRMPGKRTLSGLATAFHALIAAGGPTPRGSMRDVRVLRNNQEVGRFDLYPFLLQGDRSHDVRLESGDVVFVASARPRAGIQGAVNRPGVYEMEAPCSLRRLLALAGGITPFADVSRIQIERVEANGGFRLQDLPLDHGHGVDPDSLLLNDYDLLTVLPLNERVRNLVTLDGYVRHPGSYELKPGMMLSGLVTRDQLLPEAALDQAELRRVNPVTFTVEVHPFRLSEVLAGRGDIALQALDAVTVFSAARMPHQVTLAGEVERPGIYTIVSGERFSSLLARAGGLTPRGSLRATVFTRPSAAAKERDAEHEFLMRQQVDIARQRVDAAAGGDSVNANALAQAQNALLLALDRSNQPGRVVLEIAEGSHWENTVRDPMLEDNDSIEIPEEPTTVVVVGSVKNPGTQLARRGASGNDYLRAAGGPSGDADLGRSYVLRANGTAVRYQGGVDVKSGDALIIAPKKAETNSVAKMAGGGLRVMSDFAVAAALLITALHR